MRHATGGAWARTRVVVRDDDNATAARPSSDASGHAAWAPGHGGGGVTGHASALTVERED